MIAARAAARRQGGWTAVVAAVCVATSGPVGRGGAAEPARVGGARAEASTALAAPGDVRPLLQVLRAVGPKGAGDKAAAGAWRELVRADVARLPEILAAIDGANPLAANWMRAAVERIAEREVAAGRGLPTAELERFALNTSHNPRARRLAFEWLARADKSAPDRLIPGMLGDPSPELRGDAVARLIKEAEAHFDAKRKAEARATYEKALSGAVEKNQVQAIARRLRELGVEVDLPRQFGFVTEWKLIGPFDHRGAKMFDVAYPPEKEVRLDAEYEGKNGTVKWTDAATNKDDGLMDLNQIVGKHKGAIQYATAEFTAERARPVEVRVGCINAVKVWLNGRQVIGVEEYHHPMQMDQYRGAGALRAGKNVILMKVCQNEQTEDWAQNWQFQLRVCDATGSAVLSTTRPAKREAGRKTAAAKIEGRTK